MKLRIISMLAAVASSMLAMAACNNDTMDESVENTTTMTQKINVAVNGHTLSATLVDNSSTRALVALLQKGDVTINAHDYGNFEKVGDLPESLPTNNEQITTSAGDIILYLGTSICFYYAQNSWNFTRLGRIDNAEQYDLKSIYGDGNATFVLSLPLSTVIDATSAAATVAKTSIYTTDGKLMAQSRVEDLPSGTYVVRDTMSDGTVQSRKINI